MARLKARLIDQPAVRATGFDLDHGGRLQQARALFPQAPEPFVDLSTAINPVPYPVPHLPPEVWSRLPEPESIAELESVAARRYGVADPAMVAAVPGTQTLISLLPKLFPQERVAVLGPTYGEYAAAYAKAGSEVVEVSSLEDSAGAGIVLLCNPNNPDGRRFPSQTILQWLSHARDLDLLLVDEAFADLDTVLGLAPHLPQPPLLILRSLSKAYGLAGLRLGFALAAAERAAGIRAALGPWPISGPAIATGARALQDDAWLQTARTRLARGVERLDALLEKAGLRVIGGTLLFRLVETEHAGAWFERLGKAGIFVRAFQRHANWLRFGLPGDDDQWQRLAQALT